MGETLKCRESLLCYYTIKGRHNYIICNKCTTLLLDIERYLKYISLGTVKCSLTGGVLAVPRADAVVLVHRCLLVLWSTRPFLSGSICAIRARSPSLLRKRIDWLWHRRRKSSRLPMAGGALPLPAFPLLLPDWHPFGSPPESTDWLYGCIVPRQL